MLLLRHKTLKGSRNIQGFALIRAVLLFVCGMERATKGKRSLNREESVFHS